MRSPSARANLAPSLLSTLPPSISDGSLSTRSLSVRLAMSSAFRNCYARMRVLGETTQS